MIDRKQIEHIARLARLRLSKQETEEYTRQLGSIFEFAEQLNKVDTGSVEPTCFLEPPHDPLRDDREKPSLSREEALQNAPLAKKGFFAVPKVIG